MSRKSLPRPVKTENVGIEKASVSIRILQVNNKQMTLAVFRQVRRANFVSHETGELRADVDYWGRINYSIENESEWAIGVCCGELLRSPIEGTYWDERATSHVYTVKSLLNDKRDFTAWLDKIFSQPADGPGYPTINKCDWFVSCFGDRFFAHEIDRDGDREWIEKEYEKYDSAIDRERVLRDGCNNTIFLYGLPQIFIAV